MSLISPQKVILEKIAQAKHEHSRNNPERANLLLHIEEALARITVYYARIC